MLKLKPGISLCKPCTNKTNSSWMERDTERPSDCLEITGWMGGRIRIPASQVPVSRSGIPLIQMLRREGNPLNPSIKRAGEMQSGGREKNWNMTNVQFYWALFELELVEAFKKHIYLPDGLFEVPSPVTNLIPRQVLRRAQQMLPKILIKEIV